jgi:nucleolar protein 53
MSIKTAAVEAPKKSKGSSKKNKKSWRKNTSIEDIEEFLDDQRLEERLGGSFDTRKDEDLFMVDTGKQEHEEEKPEEAPQK